MQTLRTPQARFEGLTDYPFAPNYLQVDDTEGGQLRLHYLDEGPRNGAPVLLLHGEPTWSYLYRHMIPVLVEQGHRVIAPDLIGFGKSDKPVRRADYTYQRHIDWTGAVLRQLDLQDITLFCQDWGGLIGLRLWAGMPERFCNIVVANTTLPTGEHPMPEAFLAWRDYSQQTPGFRSGRIVHGGTSRGLSEADVAAYDAPFPDPSYQAGARQLPMLVPADPDDPASGPNQQAWRVLHRLNTPVLTLFGADDKVMAGAERSFQKLPGAAGQAHRILPGAGHFLQEDVGVELARLTNDFIARS